MLFALAVLATLGLTWLNFYLGWRMGFEVARYVALALRHRSRRAQNIGWYAGLWLGRTLWLPLIVINRILFGTAYPVTDGGRTPPRR